MLSTLILILAAVAAALMAGLFYAWSCSIVPGLATVPDDVYVQSMQAFNKAILNPVFFAGFMGALLLLPITAYLHYTPSPSLRFWLLVAAAIVYAAGVFGVTAAGNVPLNDGLAAFDLAHATPEMVSAAREKFEAPWNQLQTIRTVCAIATSVLTIIGCISK